MTLTELGMFAKYWQPGRVKTRLAVDVGGEEAAAVYEAGLKLLVHRFAELADRRTIAYWPPACEFEFRHLAAGRWQLQLQVAGDLGLRISTYFRDAFARGSHHVVLIGSDSPTLPTAHILQAFAELQHNAVVLGPSHDGGYYLVAGRPDLPSIFDGIPWSTPEVWSSTCAALRRHGTIWSELSEWYDVDDSAGLRRLAAELAATADENCVHRRQLTAAVAAAVARL